MRCRCLAFSNKFKAFLNEGRRAPETRARGGIAWIQFEYISINILPRYLWTSSAFQFSEWKEEKKNSKRHFYAQMKSFFDASRREREREASEAWALIFSFLLRPSANSTSAYRVSRQSANGRRRLKREKRRKTCFGARNTNAEFLFVSRSQSSLSCSRDQTFCLFTQK